MKINVLYLIIFLFCAFSCQQQNKVGNTSLSESEITDTFCLTADSANLTLEISDLHLDTINTSTDVCNYGEWLTLDSAESRNNIVYVSNEKGTYYYIKPDLSSVTVGLFEFGEKLIVIDSVENWYKVLSNGSVGEFSYEEYSFSGFVSKDEVVNYGNVDFSVIPTEKEVSNLDFSFNKKGKLKIKFSEIKEEFFQEFKSNYDNKIVLDASKISKQDTFFTLTTAIGLMKFSCENNYYSCDEYLGYVPFLNSYVIHSYSSKEYESTFLVDKKTGDYYELPPFESASSAPLLSKEGDKTLLFSFDGSNQRSTISLFINQIGKDYVIKDYTSLEDIKKEILEVVWVDSETIALKTLVNNNINYLKGTIINKN